MTTTPHSSPADPDQLDLVFGALSDRTRRAILDRLSRGEVSVTELTAGFDMSQPAVSKHLRVLERAGLIARTRQGTMRLSRLEAGPLGRASDWLGSYREYWEESFSRLDALLAGDAAPAPSGSAGATAPSTTSSDQPNAPTEESS